MTSPANNNSNSVSKFSYTNLIHQEVGKKTEEELSFSEWIRGGVSVYLDYTPSGLALSYLARGLGGCSEQKFEDTNEKPTAKIISPANETTFYEGEEITFLGEGDDIEDDDDGVLSDLQGIWSSNVDDILNDAFLSDEGISSFTKTLSPGDHTIEFKVIDTEGDESEIKSISLHVVDNLAPEVQIIQPNNGDEFYKDQLVILEVEASDAEDTADLLSVSWKSDLDGVLKEGIVPDDNGIATTAVYLSEGEHLLTATVTDSLGQIATDVVTVAVRAPNNLPECEIQSPANDSVYRQGESITFAGLVSDAEIPATSLNVEWSSDKDGLLGSSLPDSRGQVNFSYNSLSVNDHTISMVVTDEVGGTCTSNVSVAVGNPPTVSIASPLDGESYEEGETIRFSATVSDAQDYPEDLTIEWSSDIDGVFNTARSDSSGNIDLSYSALSAEDGGADHLITLRVTDTTGLDSTEAVLVTIIPPEVCDEIDNDGDGDVDEGLTNTYYADVDGDGCGDAATTTTACVEPLGYVSDTSDLDDSVAANATPFNGQPDDCTVAYEGPYTVTDVFTSNFEGWQSSQNLGFGLNPLANAGDLDGDGDDELWISSPFYDASSSVSNSGSAHLVNGGTVYSGDLESNSLSLWEGADTNGEAGQETRNIGDMDGDGIDDAAFSLYTTNHSVAVILGNPTAVTNSFDDADLILEGVSADTFGNRFSAGDFDGDGLKDLAVSARFHNSHAGAVYVYQNTTLNAALTGSQLLTASEADWVFNNDSLNEYAGLTLALDGDINSDGFDDLAITTTPNSDLGNGRINIVQNSSASPISTGSHMLADVVSITVEVDSDDFYYSSPVAYIDDLDGDSGAELLLGSAFFSLDGYFRNGGVYLFTSSTLNAASSLTLNDADQVVQGSADSEGFGHSLSTGNVDGDGAEDLIAGSTDSSTLQQGIVLLLYGANLLTLSSPNTGTDQEGMVRIMGSGSGVVFGYSSIAADVDGNGVDEVVACEPYESVSGTDQEGTCYILENNY